MKQPSKMKKSLEMKYLKEVEKIYPNFPKGTLLPFERPDFLLESQNGIIGIEITRLIRQQNNFEFKDRRVEAEQRKALNLAKKKFEAKNKMPLWVSVSWRYHNNLGRKLIDLIANDIIELVEKNISEVIFEPLVIDDLDFYSSKLSDYCYFILIMRQLKKSNWVSENPASPPFIPSEIGELILKKAKKAQGYHNKCKELWLLIVLEGIDSGSVGDIGDKIINYNFESPFDKILLYDRVEKLVHFLHNKKSGNNSL